MEKNGWILGWIASENKKLLVSSENKIFLSEGH